MIIYFANRHMEILGQASTNLPKGTLIKEDKKTEEIETGVATFDCRIPFTKASRKKTEQMTEVGNYILRSDGDENEFYTIIDAEIDTENRDVYVYAEDAGLDLLNEIVLEYSSDEKHTLKYFFEKWLIDTGFEIGIDESTDEAKELPSVSESTATERLNYVAQQFGYEISFSFAIDRMTVIHKYVNIYKKRGKDVGTQLRLNKDIDKIITKKSIANLATAFLCTGADIEGTDFKTTLDGYKYDDGDFYVDGHYLKSRNAVAKWGRYVWKDEPNKLNGYEGHIVKTFSYDTVSQEELCKQAIEELKKVCEIECNYEVDLKRLPGNVKIGDIVNIDDEGELYLSARILKLETSICENTRTATLGEYLIKDSGISQRVEELATQFAQIAKSRTFYTWIAYADDKYGAGITLDPEDKLYMGIAANRLKAEVDISDPGIFSWSKVTGDPGETGRSPEMIENQYYLSTSSENTINGEWSFEIPIWENGKYIWKRSAITWSDKTVTYTEPVLDAAVNHANEASEYAKQQADAAKEAAVNAETAAVSAENNAAIASNASIVAQNTANDASMAATAAQDIANAAQKSADEANAEVILINKEVSNIKEDATLLREDLEGQITTVKDIMEVSYAKKTDVSETEMTLKAEISKSAAEIQTTMSSNYAKKTDLTAVQANLQTQVTHNATNITSTAKAVEEVRIDASNAQKKATEAVTAAGNSQNAADTALQKANDAQVSAEQSTQAALDAQKKATEAQTKADDAKKAANNADAVAAAAKKDLNDAKENLETVKNRVDATEEDIAAAQAAVDNAQISANEANAAAERANTVATTAQTTADKAKIDAKNAQDAADNAQTNAQNAKTAADNAQKTADETNQAIGNLANTVTEMDTKIDQNADAISLAATKTEVAEYLSGYSTTAQMNAVIQAKADSITQSVSATYVTKSDHVSDINTLNASLELKVNKDKLISEINASADVITLTGNRFIVNSDNFKLTGDGTITANNGSFSGSITATSGILGGYKISENKLFSEKIVSPKGGSVKSGSVYVDCYDANGNQVDVQGKNVNVNERQKSSISIEPGIVTAEGWEKSYYYEVVGSNHYGYNEITYNKININNGINLFTKYVTGSLKNQSEINADPTTTSFNDCMNLFMDGGNIRLHSGSIVGGEFVENTVEPFVDITSSGIIIDPGNSNTAVQIENASYIDGIDTSGNFIHLIRAMNNTCAVGDSNFQTGIYGNSLSIKCTTTVSGNMKATNHIMNGNKTGYQDGKTGIYLNSDGYMHLQRASSSGDPYIGFLRDSSTSISSLTLRSNGKFRFNKALELDGTNIDAVGERGIYSTTMSNYIVRYYVTDSNVKCTALGNNSYATRIYGSSVWANKAVSTSDVRYKEDFHPLDAYEKMFMYLEPVTFKWKRDYEENDDRIHFGLKAQQVEEAFAKAGFNVTNYSIVEDYGMEKGLCYNDLLPTTIHMTQKNTKELMHQAGKIDLHETIIRDLQNRIYQLEKQLKELKQAVA